MKDLIPAACSLCEYTLEVVACMVLTGKRRPWLDIWPETPEQAKFTNDMMRSIWGKEAHWQCGGLSAAHCPPPARRQDLWVRSTAMAILLLIRI